MKSGLGSGQSDFRGRYSRSMIPKMLVQPLDENEINQLNENKIHQFDEISIEQLDENEFIN